MVVAIFGIGLIGGSVAKDLRAANFCTDIIGVGRSEASNETALKLGLVDKIVTREAAIKLADLIILTVPVNSLINELKFVLDNIQSHQTVTDIAPDRAPGRSPTAIGGSAAAGSAGVAGAPDGAPAPPQHRIHRRFRAVHAASARPAEPAGQEAGMAAAV